MLDFLPPAQKWKLRKLYMGCRERIVKVCLSYGKDELVAGLRRIGICAGDTVMVHGAFNPYLGFKGSPGDVIDAFLDALGPTGNLLMVSMPYTSSTYEYLGKSRCFDVRTTVSMMGVISESFRGRGEVIRSLSPTHPVLAHGPKTDWIIGGHNKCLYPCGPGSPFEKLALLNGKVVFFAVPFETFTFFHYLEHMIKDELGFPLYFRDPVDVPMIDHAGERHLVKSFVFSLEANRRRRPGILKAEAQSSRHYQKGTSWQYEDYARAGERGHKLRPGDDTARSLFL